MQSNYVKTIRIKDKRVVFNESLEVTIDEFKYLVEQCIENQEAEIYGVNTRIISKRICSLCGNDKNKYIQFRTPYDNEMVTMCYKCTYEVLDRIGLEETRNRLLSYII
jgi:DNA-directed RNA polymerase subunit M/transcription elongation factor TFIIS